MAETVSLITHLRELRKADEKFMAERDRRYTEVGLEKEKALKIKETADLAALELARQIQTYKDEQANKLREQISSERGSYATQTDLKAQVEKIEASIEPLKTFATSQQGRSGGIDKSWGTIVLIFTLVISVTGLLWSIFGR